MAFLRNREPFVGVRVWMVKTVEGGVYLAHEHFSGMVMESDPANGSKARDAEGDIIDPSWLCSLLLATGRTILIDPDDIDDLTPMFAV